MKICGHVILLGDDVSVDELHPQPYFSLLDARIAEGTRNGILSGKNLKTSILITGDNFGWGSSREVAIRGLKLNGVQLIISKSVGRIFYRNCINLALPIVLSGSASDVFEEGEFLEVNLTTGIASCPGKVLLRCDKLEPLASKIIEAGGLMNYLKKRG